MTASGVKLNFNSWGLSIHVQFKEEVDLDSREDTVEGEISDFKGYRE